MHKKKAYMARNCYFNAPQVYFESGVKAALNPFGRRPAKAGAIMIGWRT